MNRLSRGAARRSFVCAATAIAASLVGGTSYATTVTTGNITANFRQVGTPQNAMKIAACSPQKLYALNENESLWVNYNGGNDQSWEYLTTPQNAQSIACDGETLIAMNYDHSIWRYTGGSSWTEFATASGAMQIGGGPGVATALNYDQSFWTSVGNDVTSFPGAMGSWIYRGTPGAAARLAGSIDHDNYGRFFALNYDGSLWINDAVITGDTGGWREFNNGLGGGVPVEIAAASPDELYILDNSHRLWTVSIAESTLVGTGPTVEPPSNMSGYNAVWATYTVTLNSAGGVVFQPVITNHDKATGFMYSLTCGFTDANNKPYTVQHTGHVNPAPLFSITNTDAPTWTSTNAQLAANWAAVNANWTGEVGCELSTRPTFQINIDTSWLQQVAQDLSKVINLIFDTNSGDPIGTDDDMISD